MFLTAVFLFASGALADSPAPGWFYPGRGEARAVLGVDGRLQVDGRDAGLVLRRTGAVLARAEDPALLAALPEVASSQVLGGDGHVVRLQARPGVDELALSRALHDRPDVAWAHPDLVLPLRPAALPDDPYVGDQWHLENTGQDGWTPGADIDAETAWAVTQGEGALVAVLDGGVEVDHPDLDGIAGWDYVDGDADPYPDPTQDGAAHGTCAAGIAVARGGNALGVAGVAYGGQVYGIRLLGDATTTADVYDALVEATDAGAWVLSNSWGFDNGCSTYTLWGAIENGLDYAEENGRDGLGAVVVVAAGNGDCDNSGDGFQQHEAVISVAASNGYDEREWYSSYGDVVDVAAPSGAILTTDLSGDPGYGSYGGDADYVDSFSGTSAAAPVVSGVVALMLAANPRLTAAQVRQVLCETAEPIDVDSVEGAYDEEGWSPWYGCGRVDAGAAVLAVANAAPELPVPFWPVETAVEDRVLLAWEGQDPDGDRLTWEVAWSTGGEPVVAQVEEPILDLTGQVAVGEVVDWTVRAIDLWGASEAASASFEVVAVEQAPPAAPAATGCQAAPGAGLSAAPAGLLGLAGLVGLRRRRAGRTA